MKEAETQRQLITDVRKRLIIFVYILRIKIQEYVVTSGNVYGKKYCGNKKREKIAVSLYIVVRKCVSTGIDKCCWRRNMWRGFGLPLQSAKRLMMLILSQS